MHYAATRRGSINWWQNIKKTTIVHCLPNMVPWTIKILHSNIKKLLHPLYGTKLRSEQNSLKERRGCAQKVKKKNILGNQLKFSDNYLWWSMSLTHERKHLESCPSNGGQLSTGIWIHLRQCKQAPSIMCIIYPDIITTGLSESFLLAGLSIECS